MVKYSMTANIVAVLTVVLFFTGVFSFINGNSAGYDVADLQNSSFSGYLDVPVNDFVSDVSGKVGNVSADESGFDLLGSLVNRALSPFKAVIGGVTLLKDVVDSLFSELHIPRFIIQYVLAVIVVVVFVAIFLFRILLNRDDEVDNR